MPGGGGLCWYAAAAHRRGIPAAAAGAGAASAVSRTPALLPAAGLGRQRHAEGGRGGFRRGAGGPGPDRGAAAHRPEGRTLAGGNSRFPDGPGGPVRQCDRKQRPPGGRGRRAGGRRGAHPGGGDGTGAVCRSARAGAAGRAVAKRAVAVRHERLSHKSVSEYRRKPGLCGEPQHHQPVPRGGPDLYRSGGHRSGADSPRRPGPAGGAVPEGL